MSRLWRDSGRPVRFFMVDGRAAIGILLVLLHISLETLMLAIFVMVAFAVLERFDYTVPNALRKARSIVAGRRRRAVASWRKQGYRSF